MSCTRLAAAISLVVLAACSDGVGPGDGGPTFLATIEVDEDQWPLRLVAPETSEAGVPFLVTVASYFNDLCEEVGPTEVSFPSDLEAVVVPLDRRTGTPNCPDAGIGVGEHVASIAFPRSGNAIIRVLGRSGLSLNSNDTLVVDIPLVVGSAPNQ